MSEIEDQHYGEAERSTGAIARYPAEDVAGRPAHQAQQQRKANPDDPAVQRPRRGPHGPLPGPRELGAPGRVAIVQGQVFLVGVILVAQLWLITDALFELLSGRAQMLGWLALASGVGLLVALLVWLWPHRRTIGR